MTVQKDAEPNRTKCLFVCLYVCFDFQGYWAACTVEIVTILKFLKIFSKLFKALKYSKTKSCNRRFLVYNCSMHISKTKFNKVKQSLTMANKVYQSQTKFNIVKQSLTQAGLSWGSVQAKTVRLQSWIEPGSIDICWNLLN